MSGEASRGADLEVDEDMAFQRRAWRAERIGWVVMSFLLAAAALGLFSSGPLSSATATDPDRRLTADYERFHRLGAPGVFALRVPAPDAAPGFAEVELDRGFLETFHIETIRPAPIAETALEDGIRLRFAVAPAASADVRLAAKPARAGPVRARIRLPGRAPLELNLFVYP